MRYLVLILFIFFSHVNADEIQRVESIIKDIKKLRSDYDSAINELNIYKVKLKEQEDINKKCFEKKKISSKNLFPKLKMQNEIKYAKAKSFRLNKNSIIYDNVDGNEILRWEKGTSFTSNIKQGKWIKITGYFIHKAWKKSKKSMWIKSLDATLRK